MKLVFAVTCLMAIEGAFGFTSFSTKPSLTRCNLKVDGRTVENEVKPTNNFILVKKADAIESTEGGIILTGKSKEKKTAGEGVVVKTGPGKTHHETGALFDMPVETGEGVVFGKYAGTQMTIDGIKHSLITDDDIIVKYNGDKLTLESVEVVRDTVLVSIETKESSSDSGILIARSSKSENKPSTGKVIKVGPGRLATNGALMEMEVAAGDFVKFRDFAAASVEIDDVMYSVVRMADVLAKY
jgi:chaperonin GroES